MERPAKRPRLLTPLDSLYNASYHEQHQYCEMPENESNDYDELEEEVEEEEYDPDQDLQQQRARVDFKLKSTFEAIFEKYSKDFEGIGDEIDLRTGEILVNNGHILAMRHEVDAGDSRTHSRGDQSFSNHLDDISGSEEEEDEGEEEDEEEEEEEEEDEEEQDDQSSNEHEITEENDEGYDDEGPLSDEEMVEDDMILRGFAQASQKFINTRQAYNPGPPKHNFPPRTDPADSGAAHPKLPGRVLPSQFDILAQFGPQLGPEIVNYISRRGALPENKIERAWRVPDIIPTRPVPDVEPAWRVPNINPNPHPTPVKRPLIKSMVVQPDLELERSPSPENAPSIWAVPQNPTSLRKRFSPQEDQLLLDFVTDARRQGLDLSSMSTWKRLESMNPRRDGRSWKRRYNAKFTYLRHSPAGESDLSTSEALSSTDQIADQRLNLESGFARPAPARPRTTDAQRPARVRKPAQRDGIISWSEAIATIESIDPVGNAGLLDDVRRTGLPLPYKMPAPSMSLKRRISVDNSAPRRLVEQSHEYLPRHELCSELLSGADGAFISNSASFPANFSPVEEAPCPHAKCKTSSSILYRLERRHHEELSPMCSHLFYEHNITPFPCGESNCERKGVRGYFMQLDLVRHVRESHPYASALRRLRGRVDPALLEESNLSEKPLHSVEWSNDVSFKGQARDSDFMVQQRSYSSHGLSSTQNPFLGSGQKPDQVLTPRAGARAVSADASSTLVHQSPERIKSVSPINLRAISSDSDLQILDGNPFIKESESSKKNHASISLATRRSDGDNNAAHRSPLMRSQAPPVNTKPCKYPGCGKLINNGPGNMFLHLEAHEKLSRASSAAKEPHSVSSCKLLSNVSNPQSSSRETNSRAFIRESENSHSSRPLEGNMPVTHVGESFIDRSYEFSDEDDGIRPGFWRPAPKLPIPQKPISVPQSLFFPPTKVESPQSASAKVSSTKANTQSYDTKEEIRPAMRMPRPDPLSSPKPLSDPQSFFAPPTRLKSLRIAAAEAPPTEVGKGPVKSHQPVVATPSEPETRKLAIHNVLASDEFDELSLGEDGFILLSVRPRSNKQVRLNLPIQVKDEEADNQSSLVQSSKKRLLSSLLDYDDIDELAGDSPMMSTPCHPGPLISPAKTPVRVSGGAAMHRMLKPKWKKGSTNMVELQTSSSSMGDLASHVSTTRHQQVPAQRRLPSMDIAKRDSSEVGASRAEIPSTSELGSSPTSRLAETNGHEDAARLSNLLVLVTPHKQTWVGRRVKQEDAGVVTIS